MMIITSSASQNISIPPPKNALTGLLAGFCDSDNASIMMLGSLSESDGFLEIARNNGPYTVYPSRDPIALFFLDG